MCLQFAFGWKICNSLLMSTVAMVSAWLMFTESSLILFRHPGLTYCWWPQCRKMGFSWLMSQREAVLPETAQRVVGSSRLHWTCLTSALSCPTSRGPRQFLISQTLIRVSSPQVAKLYWFDTLNYMQFCGFSWHSKCRIGVLQQSLVSQKAVTPWSSQEAKTESCILLYEISSTSDLW